MDAGRALPDPVHVTATTAPIGQTRPRWLRYPFSRQLGRDLGYLLVGFATAVLSFSVFVAGLSVTVSLIVFVVGFPIALGWFWVNRGLADLARDRARWVLGERVPRAYRTPVDSGMAAQVKTRFRDPQTWRDLLWTALDGVIGFAIGTAAVTIWASWLGTLVLPAWWWSMPGDAQLYGLWQDTTTAQTFLGPLLAIALYVPIAWLTRALALAHARMSAWLLAPTRSSRVQELEVSRAGAVDASHSELQRIERDLHDGAQARLVALAMELGLAERKIAEDPDASRELIGEAREETLRALGELRELVRGIGPSILRDRGLEAAVASLAAGRAQPIDARVDVGDPRPPATVESAAYFVVAESLANAARHSSARRVTVRVWRAAGDRLVVEVADDGNGGADPAKGTGLSGLTKRVAALDGSLTVTSPAGGPTTVRAEIPCEL
jgi:signal transduction histidine kinase